MELTHRSKRYFCAARIGCPCHGGTPLVSLLLPRRHKPVFAAIAMAGFLL
jgi:hypothetical protein